MERVREKKFWTIWQLERIFGDRGKVDGSRVDCITETEKFLIELRKSPLLLSTATDIYLYSLMFILPCWSNWIKLWSPSPLSRCFCYLDACVHQYWRNIPTRRMLNANFWFSPGSWQENQVLQRFLSTGKGCSSNIISKQRPPKIPRNFKSFENSIRPAQNSRFSNPRNFGLDDQKECSLAL